MAFCIHCGKQLVEGARFCAFCGQSTNGNIALQGSAAGSVVPAPVKVQIVENKPVGEREKIIAHLRDRLGLEAEKTDDGGVRVVRRLKQDGKYELDQALEVIVTPEGRKLKGIRVPEGVTEIGDRAFFGAWGLQYIELPVTLRKIGRSAFAMCPLEEIHFPRSLTHIADSAFSVTGLRTVRLPDHLQKLSASVFSSCEKLTEVVLPSGLTEIGDLAFSDCRKLQKVQIPKGVQRIGSSAFQGCKALQEIALPAGVKRIEQYTFDNCVSLCQVTYQPGAEIDKTAFRGCKKVDAKGNPTGYQKKVPPAKLSPDFDADKVIAYLRDYLGMDSEKAEDGGVRVTQRRYAKDIDMWELNLMLKPMITPSGCKAKGIILPEGVTEIADEAFYMAWGLEYSSNNVLGKC